MSQVVSLSENNLKLANKKTLLRMKPGSKAMKATDAVLALLNDDDDDDMCDNDVEDEDIESESEDDEDDLPLSVLVKKSSSCSGKKALEPKKPLADEPKKILSDKTNNLSNNKCVNVSNCKSIRSEEAKYNALKYNYVLKNLFSFLSKFANEKENLNLKDDYVEDTSDEEGVNGKKYPSFQDSLDLTKSPSIKLLKMNYQREKIAVSSPVFALNSSTNKRKRI